jgi:Cu2+-exporting ATPase
VVQVVASGKLLKQGVLVKSADALEKLADIDEVVFDKTGTLTTGNLVLLNGDSLGAQDRKSAVSLARQSSHPLSKALASAFESFTSTQLTECEEVPGMGLRAKEGDTEIRLGSRDWVAGIDKEHSPTGPQLWFRRGNDLARQLLFRDQLRPSASATLETLQESGLETHLLSGDQASVVQSVAQGLNFAHVMAEQKPGDKITYLEGLAKSGAKALMVGDGLNDAPALKAAHVSMSPASASDISQNAADFIFQGTSLAPVAETLSVARQARSHILQNFAMAFAYNTVAVPLAMAGIVTPLIAAVAMSSSSILVTANAMRMNWKPNRQRP